MSPSATRTRTGHRTGAPARSPALALLVICAGYFLVILDAMVVNVALPSIGHDLHGGVAGLQWTVDAYTLSFAGLLLTGGALAERLGGRPVFTGGTALFALASAACGLAPSMSVLIAARFVQGAGAAALVPSSLVLLQAAFPARADRSRALGVWGSVGGIGAASGPVIGGLLVSGWSWRGVFFINLPVALAILVLADRTVPASERGTRAVDLPGQLLSITALALLTAALVQAGRDGWTAPAILAGFALAAVAATAFVLTERRSRAPMLPPGLFRVTEFRSGTLVGLLINLGFYGQLFVMSLYFQDIRGYSALRTGLALLPEAALLVIGSTLSGRIMARTGPRTPMLAGLLAGAAGLGGIAAAATTAPYPVLAVAMGTAGFGMSMVMPAATAAVMEAAPPDRGGIASGVINAARQAGGVLGVALLGTLVPARASFAAGLQLGVALSAGAFLLGAVLTATGVPRHHADAGEAASEQC
jgi:DHA2 family methylenomycin A resistance protein-like MFS transporter